VAYKAITKPMKHDLWLDRPLKAYGASTDPDTMCLQHKVMMQPDKKQFDSRPHDQGDHRPHRERLLVTVSKGQEGRFQIDPREQHGGKAVKWLEIYLAGNRDKGMILKLKEQSFDIYGQTSTSQDEHTTMNMY
jgi:hypothetical protein